MSLDSEPWNLTTSSDGFGLVNMTAEDEDLESYEQFRDMSRFWIQRILLPLIVCVGVLGNVVSIVVLTKKSMRSSTNIYLTALAVSDLLYLMFLFILSLKHYPNIKDPTGFNYVYWQYFRFGIWLADATSSTSVWLTVSFTVERYIAVCHPMRGRALCTESRAKMIIIMVYIFCFLFTISTPFEWKVVETVSSNNVTVLKLMPTELAENETYRTVFYWASSIVTVFLPFILLSIFNSFLIHAVHYSQRQRKRMTQAGPCDSKQSQENKITITLIAVVILFMVCQTPTAVTLIYMSFSEPEQGTKAHYVLLGLGNIFNFLVAINAACNFVLYCAFSDKYRRTFLLTFLPWWYKQPSPLHSVSNYNTIYSSMEESSPRFSTRGASVRVPRTSTCSEGRSGYLMDKNGLLIANNSGNTASGGGTPLLKRHASAYVNRDQVVRRSKDFPRSQSLLSRSSRGRTPSHESVGLTSNRDKRHDKDTHALLCLNFPKHRWRFPRRFWRGSNHPEPTNIQITITDGESIVLASNKPNTVDNEYTTV